MIDTNCNIRVQNLQRAFSWNDRTSSANTRPVLTRESTTNSRGPATRGTVILDRPETLQEQRQISSLLDNAAIRRRRNLPVTAWPTGSSFLPLPFQASSFQPHANLWLNIQLLGATMTRSETFEMRNDSKATTFTSMDAVLVSDFAFTCFEIWAQPWLPILQSPADP
jgi:hypothetical protein